MSKKNFQGGLSSLLGDQPEITLAMKTQLAKPKKGRPVVNFKEITKSSQEGTKENEIRATFIVNEELLEKLKNIAYWERLLIKEVVNSALIEAVAKYEKKNGVVKPKI
jgi:hypothetical protein